MIEQPTAERKQQASFCEQKEAKKLCFFGRCARETRQPSRPVIASRRSQLGNSSRVNQSPAAWLFHHPCYNPAPENQKFFGSFFQKRTSSFLPRHAS